MKNNLAEEYTMDSLEPGVDPEEARAFLSAKPPADTGSDPSAAPGPVVADTSIPVLLSEKEEEKEVLVSRTVRLRLSTAEALTDAVLDRKQKRLTLNSVQEIFDGALRMVLHQLGYLDTPD